MRIIDDELVGDDEIDEILSYFKLEKQIFMKEEQILDFKLNFWILNSHSGILCIY